MLPAAVRAHAISQVQQAGTIAGSLGLPADPSHPNPDAGSAVFPLIQQVARHSFVDGTVFILWIAALIMALGTVASAFMIRRKDMVHEQEAAALLKSA